MSLNHGKHFSQKKRKRHSETLVCRYQILILQARVTHLHINHSTESDFEVFSLYNETCHRNESLRE
jgi:hypothetical protein